MERGIALLEGTARLTRLFFIGIGLLTAGVGIAMATWVFTHGGLDYPSAKGIAGAVLAPPVGLALLARGLLQRSRALAALRSSPQQIVWWYVRQMGPGDIDVGLGLESGKLDVLSIKASREEAAVIEAGLAKTLPHASRGYSDVLAARFKSDARALRRDDLVAA